MRSTITIDRQIRWGNQAARRSINVMNASAAFPPARLYASTNTLGRSLPASTVIKPMYRWVHLRCTYVRIRFRANAQSVVRHSVGRGCYRDIFARTQERSHINALSACVRSPTVPICVPTCKRILPWKNTAAHNVCARFPECLFSLNISKHAEMNCELQK